MPNNIHFLRPKKPTLFDEWVYLYETNAFELAAWCFANGIHDPTEYLRYYEWCTEFQKQIQ